jgi:Ca2+/H+ antiporter, TMEM165/GDT1 family
MATAHAITAILAAFLASIVEVTEAYTIVLAVGLSRGRRSASAGSAATLIVLTLIVAAFGPLLGRVPLAAFQLPIGLLLLLFGMGWLRKAILRAGNVIPLHDENAIFANEMAELHGAGVGVNGLDIVGALTTFQGVLLECHYIDLSPADVQAAFQKWMRPGDFVRVTQGPQRVRILLTRPPSSGNTQREKVQ